MNSQLEDAIVDLQNYSTEIPIVLEINRNLNILPNFKSADETLAWCKSLKYLPLFTIKEIENYRKKKKLKTKVLQ